MGAFEWVGGVETDLPREVFVLEWTLVKLDVVAQRLGKQASFSRTGCDRLQ